MRKAWLLPFLPRLAAAATRLYYRAEVVGGPPPRSGPVLFVANHPNSGFDPAFVAMCARRPVRFLAKAPLFKQPVIGSLLRACGAIPVYRRKDDPALMDRNVDMFTAVQEALQGGSAVGIFPEGISHSRPSLAPLRTGAARIALGTRAPGDQPFPIVPVGICLRQKDRFRSEAVAVVGSAVPWDDLAGAGTDDLEAVRELTSRVGKALREVTLNLERWEDRPAVEFAEAVYAAEFRLSAAEGERLARQRRIADGLAALRSQRPDRLAAITGNATHLAELLRALGAHPADLESRARPRATAAWSLRQVVIFLVGAPLSLAGHLVFFVPYQVTDIVGTRGQLSEDVRSTYKLLGGALVHSTWILLLAGATGVIAGPPAAVAVVLGAPLLGLFTLFVRERWRDDRKRAGRYLRLRRSGDLRGRLLLMRKDLAEELEGLRRDLDGEVNTEPRAPE